MSYNVDEVFGMLSEVLKRNKKDIELIDPDDDLEVYGLESIEAIRLIVSLEDSYNIEFQDEDLIFGKYNTINKLFSLLDAYL